MYLDLVLCFLHIEFIMRIVIKNKPQIDGIRKSCQLAAKVLDFIEPYIVAGVSTEHLNDIIHNFIEMHGAIPAPLNYKGFPKSTCISLNEVICHGIPDKRLLKNGDILNIDVTTILDGYYGDTSRMFSVGEISDDAKYLMETAKECLDIGIKQVKPGVRIGNIGYRIWRHAMLKNCSVCENFCGHGVGIQFHEEDIQINHVDKANTGLLMVPGMIFTIEPMINLGRPEAVIDKKDEWTARTIDGKLSAQYEHTILVTNDGHEILTLRDHDDTNRNEENH